MDRRIAAAVILSLFAHALLPLGAAGDALPIPVATPPIAQPSAPHLLHAARAVATPARLHQKREALVRAARTDLAAGRLSLGRFLLAANRIDAEERGQPFDLAEAEARYNDRLNALRSALADQDLREAVPAVLGDLRYHGRPGGLMADALFEGGGSCEQLSHLVAALAHDAGHQSEIALRFYGGVMADGASHLTPVAVHGDEEHDLMSGRPAVRGGARFAAADLVEVYARLHGLAPPLRGPSGPRAPEAATAERPAEARPTMVPGYPQNQDRYPGTLPLYAARAIQEPGAPGEEAGAADQARDCAYLLRMAMLNPPTIDVEPLSPSGSAPPEHFQVEPYRVPKPSRLEREAALLVAADALAADAAAELADRLMGWACLAALGDVAAVDFTLAGERRLAALAEEKGRHGREAGQKALAGVRWSGEEGTQVRRRLSGEFAGRTWLLLTLEGGDQVVLDLVRDQGKDDWGQVNALAALVVAPATRGRAFAIIDGLAPADQIEIMHEVFHAHDHMRPWASNFDFDDQPDTGPGAAGATWRRVYRVFRGLGWRLWEGQRPADEILAALTSEARRAGIGDAWEAALLEYCGRNLLGLYSLRASGLDMVRTLRAAVDKNGHPSLQSFRRRLDYIESQARLDATTLADAMRMK